MNLRQLLGVAATALLALLATTATAGATPPLWEPAFGEPVPLVTDADDLGTEMPLETFSFPFYGFTHTGAEKIGVTSNGLLTFNPSKPEEADNSPTGPEAREGDPKIAALWADFNPSKPEAVDGGTVYMNSINDNGDGTIDRLVFTWDSAMFGCEKQPTCRGRVQVQLLSTGRIIFGYDGVLTNQAVDNFGGTTIMPVIAKGGFVPPSGFVPDPTGVDFSEAVPLTGGDLIFEAFAGTPIRFDLDQSNLVFDPVPGGYRVTSPVDLAVSASASKPSISSGGVVTYKATASNSGSVATADVNLTDTLPQGAKVVSAKASQGSCGGAGPVSCSLGTLSPGGSATVTIEAKLVTVGTAVNRFEVRTSTPGDGHGNNLTEVQTTVTKDKIAPKGKLKIPKQSLKAVLAKGLKLTVQCNEACLAKIQLSGKKPKVKKAGKGVAELGKAGKRKLKVKIKGKARKTLSRVSKAQIQVKATFVDEAGNKKTLKKAVVLK